VKKEMPRLTLVNLLGQRRLERVILSACFVLAFSLAIECYGQEVKLPGNAFELSSQSTQQAKTDWRELISKEGRFKIKFPGEPVEEVNKFGTTTIHDFKIVKPAVEWRVNYADDEKFVSDPASLKETYSRSAEALQRENRKLILKKDIYLNNRLGIEFVLEEQDSISTTRAFLIGHRLYQVSVEKQKKISGTVEADLSQATKEFFDSFNFWAANEPQPN
jgi:hypothetical protein